MAGKYLTKSLFITASECPTKLYYAINKEYANQKNEDAFLQALAEGGFQVGELAKCYYPGGYDIDTLDYEESIEKTRQLLKEEKVIIYEGAIRYDNFFIRTDILIKEGNSLKLVEVKAKSVDEASETSFLNKNGTIGTGWKSYLQDVAFQKHVIKKAYPEFEIFANLMLTDKNAKCPSDGLNQKFKVIKDVSGRKRVEMIENLTEEELVKPIIVAVNVDQICEIIYEDKYGVDGDINYEDYVNHLSRCAKTGEKILYPVTSVCGSCEFRATEEEEAAGLKSGFKECWKEKLGWKEVDFSEATVLDIWNFRRKDKLISEGKIKLKDVSKPDIRPSSDSQPVLSTSQRQWLQIQKVQEMDTSLWLDRKGLKKEMGKWVYPLHFIDFETYTPAIPFNKGRRPYEGIAFQFSHHILTKDGQIEHKGQYLNSQPGVFPNYDFIRALKKELEADEGSIFRYAAHENTYLNMIYRQLMEDPGVTDKQELCGFIKTITRSVSGSEESWEGQRNMIDMLDLVKWYYYDPMMGGSNSIKVVLPAMLNSSKYLQEKYSKPIYGAVVGIRSLNYVDWKWIEYEAGRVRDPYKLLPKMFQDFAEEELVLFSRNDQLSDGGEAMMAYARLQFEDMSDYERKEIETALLKYCELDTLAMVMIVEGWQDMLNM